MLSKACEYGLKAMIFVMSKNDLNTCVKITEISEEIKSPPAFTAKILQKLSKKGLLNSIKGPAGGYCIPPERVKDLNLKEIVIAIDGDTLFTACGLGLEYCSDKNPCPMHEEFKKVRNGFDHMFSSTLLIDLTKGLRTNTRLKI